VAEGSVNPVFSPLVKVARPFKQAVLDFKFVGEGTLASRLGAGPLAQAFMGRAFRLTEATLINFATLAKYVSYDGPLLTLYAESADEYVAARRKPEDAR